MPEDRYINFWINGKPIDPNLRWGFFTGLPGKLIRYRIYVYDTKKEWKYFILN